VALEESARVKLKKMQGLWDKTREDAKSLTFKTRKQYIYIEGIRSVVAKETDIPYIVFEIAGADEDNKHCREDVLFQVSDDYRDHLNLQKFLKALGINIVCDLDRLDDKVRPIINKVFEAKLEVKPGKSGRTYINVEPIRFKGETAGTASSEEESVDAPF
jgi:hypothetical protein